MNNELVEYIRTNRQIYTRAAIDDRLRAAGYTDEEIDAAWQQLLDEDRGTSQNQPRRPAGSTGEGCYTALAILLVTSGVLLLFLTDVFFGGFSSTRGPFSSAPTGLLFLNIGSLVTLVVVVAGGIWLVRSRNWSPGRIAGLVAAVALIWNLVITGSCLSGLVLLNLPG